jgi:uncharacterized membrane protein
MARGPRPRPRPPGPPTGAASTGNGVAQSDAAADAAVPAEIKARIDRELAHLAPVERRRVQRLVASLAGGGTASRGSLPPPTSLREYEQIVPGAAERLIAMADLEQKHRHAWERSVLGNTRLGLCFGLLVALALVGGAIYCATLGQAALAGGFLAASALGMVPALLRGRTGLLQRRPAAAPAPDRSVPQRR